MNGGFLPQELHYSKLPSEPRPPLWGGDPRYAPARLHKKITPPQDAAPVALRAPSLGADARPYPHTRYLPLPCNDVFGFLPIRYMTCRFLACCPPTRSLHCFFECSLRASSAHRSTKSPEGLPKKTHRERASGSLFIPLFLRQACGLVETPSARWPEGTGLFFVRLFAPA